MSTYRLDHLLRPQSVAVIGASPRPGSLGQVVLNNIRSEGFPGAIYGVNPRHAQIGEVQCWPRIRDLPSTPDVIVVAAPPQAVLGVIEDAAQMDVKAAVVLTAGLGHGPGSIADAMRAKARAAGLRIVGPNCLGVLAPPARFNASFSARAPQPGRLALVSQSGAVAAGVIEWAAERGVGFSGVVSLGDSIDVDFGDCLDYFAQDAQTHAVLLYVEGVKDAQKFMSAARAASRVKPVVVVKAGRHEQGAKAAATHTGALAGSDAVYDAAFRRAGLIRAFDLDELFAAAGTLARQKPFPGDRLAILTNGGGLGVLAVDRLIDLGGVLAELSPETVARLDLALPSSWSRANPVDIIGDAPPERYSAALDALLDDPGADAILAMNCPTGVASSADAAKAVIDVLAQRRRSGAATRPVLAVWLGATAEQRAAFEAEGIPTFETEADAVRGAMHLVNYRRRLDELTRTPGAHARIAPPDRAAARKAIEGALREERRWLDPLEIADLLGAYGVPFAPVRFAANGAEAAVAAAPFLAEGMRCVVKIYSQDITHKSDVGGVRLNLETADAARDAADEMIARAVALRPQARVKGVTVHPMIVRPHARELIAGVAVDAAFGPVILFGQGGVAVEVLKDRAIDLLPIDAAQAHALMARTRVSALLAAYRNIPAADGEAIASTLERLSRMIEDAPEIAGLDLNPLLADETGALALDARIEIADPKKTGRSQEWRRFAIRPYPREWERVIALADGTTLQVRPIKPRDEAAILAMLAQTSEMDLRFRFLGAVRAFDHAFVARLTQLDYARAMAFVAIEPSASAIVGVARLHGDANHETAEFAILIRSDWKQRGIGWSLMQAVIAFGRAEGYRLIEGQMLADNIAMIEMAEQLGFVVEPTEEPSVKIARLTLDRAPAEHGAA